MDVSDIVGQDGITQSRRYLIVGAQIASLYLLTEVGSIALSEVPIAGHIMRCVEVNMPIAQFVKHIAQHLKQSRRTHAIGNPSLILAVYSIPIESILFSLVVKEAIVLIHNAPQGLKVTCGRILVDFHLGTGAQQHCTKNYDILNPIFHRLLPSIRYIFTHILLTHHAIEVRHIAQHYRMGKHTVILFSQCPLIEVIGKSKAQLTGMQLYIIAEVSTQ